MFTEANEIVVVDVFLSIIKLNNKTPEKDKAWAQFMRRDEYGLNLLRNLGERILRKGVGILLPHTPHSFEDREFYLFLVRQIVLRYKDAEMGNDLFAFICRDQKYLAILTDHIGSNVIYDKCFPHHMEMAGLISRIANIQSLQVLTNSAFLENIISQLYCKELHIVCCALDAIIALVLAKRKRWKIFDKKLCAKEVGLIEAISYLLEKYAGTLFKEMEVCKCPIDCDNTPAPFQDRKCICKLFKVSG